MDVFSVYGALSMIVAYLCGSIPTAVWWGKAFHGLDVRAHGSRNAGATNTFRVLGAKAGVPVLLVDILKGFLPVRLLPLFVGTEAGGESEALLRVLLALAAVLGHLYPVFAGFKGGKGVATAYGTMLAMHPGAAALCTAVFAVVFLASRYVSLASLLSAVAFPLSLLLLFKVDGLVLPGFALLLMAVVFYTHRQNIGRLLRGTENRMSFAGKNGDKS
ncbi:MAG: glycerol-3-phosphate 1-O-acyltransferase PlsY [Flavobacteriales bacterium]|nr:glycerol-3-phosphate 1-O-acyltransferase PlsY [Flavobacteriales bacterium]